NPTAGATSRSVTPPACSEAQNRFPGRANGALTVAAHGLGLVPTINNRSSSVFGVSVGEGSTSSRPIPARAVSAKSVLLGRLPCSLDSPRQGLQSLASIGSLPSSLA